MDSLVTTPTLMLRNIKVIHIEPTDVCQAMCPLCSRETDVNFNSSIQHHLSVPTIQDLLSIESIAALDKMFMCGNYGDPAAGKYTLDIYKWFRTLNPTITLGMNTNGGLQNHDWWENLASILQLKQDYVVFSIDGLRDTNHLYRIGVNWDRLMSNVESYIRAGGSAHWDMLVYKHNEHQVKECEDLARKLGFKWFRTKVSKRSLRNGLEFPVNWKADPIKNIGISCHALKEQSMYIDAQGRVSPCCWIGDRQTNFVYNFQHIQDSWTSNSPNKICVESCSTNGNKTTFSSQWRQEIELQ
jgi:MoaA/NifB/PqqE/SkfB family radical SAM enzyme